MSTTEPHKNQTYGAAVFHALSEGKEVVVISDLHLSSGVQKNGNYDGTENFYADDSMSRFLGFLIERQKDKNTILVINGDFIDFLRIRHFPAGEEEFTSWKSMLSAIGIEKSIDELKQSVSKKEKDFGLKTNDYKSVWRLHICAMGHALLFRQLAFWLSRGNHLYILKGNHDLEWYWKPVRDHLSHILTEMFPAAAHKTMISSHLFFCDDALVIDDKIHIVHGHVFENITEVKGEPALNNGTELNLPFGSFFNRYLINRLELSYPFLDNIRPSQKILPLLIRERFPLAIKVLFYYIPFTILIVPKKMYRQVFKYLFDIFLIIILPLAIAGYAVYKNVKLPATSADSSFIGTQLVNLVKNVAPLFLSYVFARLLAMARLSSPKSFFPFAQSIFKKKQRYKDSNIWSYTQS